VIECVANLSEGRRAAVIEEMAAALRSRHASLLDSHVDPDHNRSVFTFSGPADALVDAVEALARVALARIDLREHRGVHPRIGAIDVVPFVPLQSTTMEECVALARSVGDRLGKALCLPVFLYGAAATRENRRALAAIRCGGTSGLAKRIADGDLPDYGPPHLHPTAGATAVGARGLLVAFNVELASQDLSIARRIAAAIRERDGGLPGIQALGLWLESKRRVQISMNLTDPTRTGVLEALEAVETRARAAGIEVEASELVGLAPLSALRGATSKRLRLADRLEDHVLEGRLESS
jgi:glutamate formiminotransferase